MHSEIYVNLPIKDLPRSRKFFEGMGYSFNPQFSNDVAAALVLGENLFAMLLTEPFFAGFVDKPIGDAHKTVQSLIALPCESRARVDELVKLAVAGGATTPKPPVDHGFMYQHGFHDLDGHVWEVFWMGEMPQA
ncbi:glyoxalase/bleomycin resistance/extradiol dioxygenase family protein [Variovorax sp. PCZ-1]|uniref:VOC family protein n=1 Tax=Variovorax sp. PCZ-1 TaxID=2835533 RepID=UPI001BD03295|nr:glyoxalase/bleomycin resistance/extradiol dioxygenase family protein [Variovorax sp. PCZ-1]MBS7807833.1 glyoxalase/bleomycin resistance/extradiol dioxygenase family protein [Variovorax sp. PCZ-1]